MKRILCGCLTVFFFFSMVTALCAYDFSGLGNEDIEGFNTQGDRFLVSSAFEQDGTSIYYNSSSDNEEGIIIKADGTHLVSFDLQEMTFSTYDANETVSISITAKLVGGGTVTRSVAGYPMIFGNTYALAGDMGMDISSFDDVEELNLSLTVTGSNVYNINFNTIDIADEQSFLPGTTPTVQAEGLAAASKRTSEIDLYWQSGDGSRRVVFAQQGSTGTPAIADGNAYTGQSDFSAATDIGGGWRCVYNDNGRTVNITGLSSDTAYRFAVYEYNGTGGGEAYLTTSGTNLLNAATAGVTSAVTYDFSNLGAADGDGFKPQGNRFLVSETFSQDGTAMYYSDSGATVEGMIIRPDGTHLSSFDLDDMVFSPYEADKTIDLTITATLEGGGTASRSITDFTMVHGVAYSLSCMGMDLSGFNDVTELLFDMTVENDGVWNVTFDTITIDDPVVPLAPGTTPTVQASGLTMARIDNTNMEIYWQNGDGSRRIVFFKQDGGNLPAVSDGQTYIAQPDFSSAINIGDGWRCVAKGNENYAVITGLAADTAYRIVVFEFSGSGGGEVYLTTAGTNVLDAATAAVSTASTFDFSNLGSATGDGFKPQGGRFLVSEGFEQDGTGIYFDSSAESESDIIIRSDGSNLVSFDLIDLVISPFQEDRTISLSITAQLAGGGNQSQSITQFTMLHGLQYALTFMGMDFSLFDDATELSIAVTIHESSVNNFSFETITLDNMKAPGTPPTVSTQAVTDISADVATANGTIETIGDPAAAAHGFVWNTGGTPTLADNFLDLGGAAQGSYNSPLAELSAYTTYFVRSYATNDTGTVYGNQVTFTTSAVNPVVSTLAVSAIDATSATANGTLTELGDPSPTAHGFVWNTSGSPTLADNTADLGAASDTVVFNSALSGLSAYTTYYVRSFATNAGGTVYGSQATFTTSAVAPAVSTQAVSAIGATSATANGTLTGLGAPSPTAHGFVWNSSGSPTLADNTADLGTASSTGAFNSALSGLSAHTTYYVRAYATSAAQTRYGNEITFTTWAPPIAAAGGDRTTLSEEMVTLDGTGSTDPDGSIEGWQWIQIEGPTVALSNADTATPQFEAPQVDDGREIIVTLRLTVTDNDGLTAVDNCQVTVSANSSGGGGDDGGFCFIGTIMGN